MKKAKQKKLIITAIVFAAIIAVMEYIDCKLLNGNIGEFIGIFLIGAGLFVIAGSRIKNER